MEVGINSRRVFGGGIACIASGGFSLENSRTKNSRRECRLSVLAIPVGASVRICVRGCVYPRAYVARLFVGIRRKSHTTHKNGLNSGLYDLIGIRLLKRIINPNKRPKIKPYGRVSFLSIIQRIKKRKKVGTNGLLCTVYCIDIVIIIIREL